MMHYLVAALRIVATILLPPFIVLGAILLLDRIIPNSVGKGPFFVLFLVIALAAVVWLFRKRPPTGPSLTK
jgi:hypothetical protein